LDIPYGYIDIHHNVVLGTTALCSGDSGLKSWM